MSAVQARGLGIAAGGRWVGLLVGLAGTSWLLSADDAVLVAMFLGPVLGIPLLAGVLVGALVRPGPERGPARRALLETRRVANYLPSWTPVVRWTAIAYAGLTVAGVLVGAPEVDGGGHPIVYYCNMDGLGLMPVWPSAGYLVPALVLVLVGLGAAAGALHLLVRRPRPTGVDVDHDDRARADAAAAVIAATAVLVAFPLAGLSLVAGRSLDETCEGPLAVLAQAPLYAATATATAVGAWALWSLLVPRGRA
jgi:hypothetical protein